MGYFRASAMPQSARPKFFQFPLWDTPSNSSFISCSILSIPFMGYSPVWF